MKEKRSVIILILIIGVALVLIFRNGGLNITKPSPDKQKTTIQQNEEPAVISTNPENLATILPTQTVEVTFNQPIENVGELKNSIEPPIDYTVELSSDRKTAKITPKTTFTLGTTYTLSIKPDTKFDGHKLLNKDFALQFKTINYRGI